MTDIAEERERRALWRAESLAKQAQGRPAPPPPFDPDDQSWIDAHLLSILSETLGNDGWEIADWVLDEQRRDPRRQVYDVKVYTDWGYNGFLTGTAEEIAHELADAQTAHVRATDDITCPHCDTQLLLTGGTCECGSILWTPRSWTAPDAATCLADLRQYLTNTPADTDTMISVLNMAQAAVDSESLILHSHPSTLPNDKTVTRLFTGLRWHTSNDQLFVVITPEAKWVPAPWEQLLNSLDELSYQMTTSDNHKYDHTWRSTWFQLATPNDSPPLPGRICITAYDPDAHTATVAVADCGPDQAADLLQQDDLWDAIDEAGDHFTINTATFQGWEYDDYYYMDRWEGRPTVIRGDVPIHTLTSSDTSRALLSTGYDAWRQARAEYRRFVLAAASRNQASATDSPSPDGQ